MNKLSSLKITLSVKCVGDIFWHVTFLHAKLTAERQFLAEQMTNK